MTDGDCYTWGKEDYGMLGCSSDTLLKVRDALWKVKLGVSEGAMCEFFGFSFARIPVCSGRLLYLVSFVSVLLPVSGWRTTRCSIGQRGRSFCSKA